MTTRPRAEVRVADAQEPASRPPRAPQPDHGPRQGLVDPRLKSLSILGPVAFVTAVELLHLSLEHSPWWTPGMFVVWRVARYLGFVACIAVFALMMLRLIERAEQKVVGQNRDLLIADAVSSASHGHATADAVVAAAVRSLAATTGADLVRLRFFGAPHTAEQAIDASGGPRADTAMLRVPAVDRPLRDDRGVVGRLEVWAPADQGVGDWIGPSTEAALAHQVTSAVRLARDVEELHRRRDEGHAFYAILLDISSHAGTLPTLTTIARHCRDLLGSDAAAVVINEATANSVRFDSDADAPSPCLDGSTLYGVGLPDHDDEPTGRRAHPFDLPWQASARHDIVGSQGVLGSLWVGSEAGRPFSARDRSFLGTMANLAGIAVTSAQVREQARQQEVLDERTRIAREMHDSLAQVLGAVHLRLRTLQTFPALAGQGELATEVAALAEVCEEAYGDVREVILGLRDANRADRGLVESLHDYVAKYSAHSGVEARLVNGVGGEFTLAPRTEVHLIRVIQEALTNVRKHARARHASVTITATDAATSFEVADDGRGFVAPGNGEGYGLSTMRDRVALLGGVLEVTSVPGQGTRVVATVPERPTTGGVRSSA